MTLTASTIRDNAAFAGGGVFNINGSVMLIASTISHDSASGNGGGVWNDSSGTFGLTASNVIANSAQQLGGGIYNSPGGTLVNCMSGVDVIANTPSNIYP